MNQLSGATTIVIIGAGFSGICAAIKLKQAGISDFLVLERAPDLGGVWHHNDYPGAACDVPSSLYSFSFVHDYDWTGTHGSRAEILDYMNFCVDRFDIRAHLRFDVEVAQGAWDGASCRWTVTTSRGTLEARYLLSACGLFNKPSIPQLPGLDDFHGPAFHSALWDHEAPIAGRTVAIIGTGCSSAQILPEIVEAAERVLVFQRSACHVLPKAERIFSDDERALYRRYPILRALERTALERGAAGFGAFQFDADAREAMNAQILASMSSQILGEDTRSKALPRFALGGKRPISSSTFLATLDRDDVVLISEPIVRIDPAGPVTADGRTHPVDAIIFGTGFAASDYLVPLDIVGRGGETLQALWRDGAFAYYGILVDGFPNFMMVYGPNSNVVGSILQIIEPQVEFVVALIEQAERERRLIEADHATVAAFNDRLQDALSRSVYGTTGADNYFSKAGRRIVTQWSGSPDNFIASLAAVDPRSCLVEPQTVSATS